MAVARGDIWTVSGGVYASKPRPALILQSDQFSGLGSITIVPFTSDPTAAPLIRLSISPSPQNGLDQISNLMADKVTTVSRAKLDRRIGALGEADMTRVTRAVLVVLGFA